MVQFDIKFKETDKEMDDWCRDLNRKTKRATASIHINLLDPSTGYIVLYSSHYADEETVFKDTLHEITEATIILYLHKEFGFGCKSNIYKAIADVSHILADISLYDTIKPIILTEAIQTFKNIKGFLESLGYEYITPSLPE